MTGEGGRAGKHAGPPEGLLQGSRDCMTYGPLGTQQEAAGLSQVAAWQGSCVDVLAFCAQLINAVLVRRNVALAGLGQECDAPPPLGPL